MTSELQEIPPITDTAGQYWGQPSAREILVDEAIALMTLETYRKLGRYDWSIPSGVYVGKMWARSNDLGCFLCWYCPHPSEPDRCCISTREVVFL